MFSDPLVPLAKADLNMLTVHCLRKNEAARERTGQPVLMCQELKSLTLTSCPWLPVGLRLWDGFLLRNLVFMVTIAILWHVRDRGCLPADSSVHDIHQQVQSICAAGLAYAVVTSCDTHFSVS